MRFRKTSKTPNLRISKQRKQISSPFPRTMKYTYAYKTSDGVRHEDSMNAASREEVFAALRAKGIKAIKVVAADGSKANGEIHGVRKRVVAVLVAFVAVGVGVVAYFSGTRSGGELGGVVATAFATGQDRRQVIGDAAIIEKGILSGWSDVFTLEGERFLASFAIPGVKAGQRNTSEKEFTAALENKCVVNDSDSLEVRQIKAMVEGMKNEARRYLSAGGTIVEYGKRLTERQDAEIAVYNRVKADIEKARETMTEAAFMTYWEKRNDELRNLGIKTVGLSD